MILLIYDSNSLRRKKRPLIGLGQCAWALNRYRSETLKSPGHFLRLTTISIFKLNYFQYFLKFYLLEAAKLGIISILAIISFTIFAAYERICTRIKSTIK